MKCLNCEANLVKYDNDGTIVIRNKAIVITDDHMYLICPKCKGRVVFERPQGIIPKITVMKRGTL